VELAHDAASWRPWSPGETAARLRHVRAPWAVAAGWGLELFVGSSWRGHEDIEIAVPATAFAEVAAALPELEFWVPAEDERLRPLADAPEGAHQTWGLDPGAGAWRLDVFREPSTGDTWICRRDDAIRMPYAELVERTAAGIPFVRPEVVLLFKAKRSREKDETDFEAVLPRLDPGRRAWLAGALERVHAGHPWLERLR
jgi:hypothetical protein